MNVIHLWTSSICNREAVLWRCSVKNVFLEISQNSQENTCARIAGLRINLKNKLWHRCFPVNFAKFPWIPFFTEHLWWVLQVIQIYDIFCTLVKSSFHLKTFQISDSLFGVVQGTKGEGKGTFIPPPPRQVQNNRIFAKILETTAFIVRYQMMTIM